MLYPVPGYAKVIVNAALAEIERVFARVMPYDWDRTSNPDLVPGMKWGGTMHRTESQEEVEGPNMDYRGIKLWFSRTVGNNTRTNNQQLTPSDWAIWFEELTAELKRQEEKRILQLPKRNENGVEA